MVYIALQLSRHTVCLNLYTIIKTLTTHFDLRKCRAILRTDSWLLQCVFAFTCVRCLWQWRDGKIIDECEKTDDECRAIQWISSDPCKNTQRYATYRNTSQGKTCAFLEELCHYGKKCTAF